MQVMKKNNVDYKMPEVIIPHRKPVVRSSTYNEFNENGFFFSFMQGVLLNLGIVYLILYKEQVWISKLLYWRHLIIIESIGSFIIYSIYMLLYGSRKRTDIMMLSGIITTCSLAVDAIVCRESIRIVAILIAVGLIITLILRIKWICLKDVPLKVKVKAAIYYGMQELFISTLVLTVIAIIEKAFLRFID